MGVSAPCELVPTYISMYHWVYLCNKLDLKTKLKIFVHNKLNSYTNMHVSFASNQIPFVGSGMAGLPNLKSLTALQNKTDQHRVKSGGFSVYLPNKLDLRADFDIFSCSES